MKHIIEVSGIYKMGHQTIKTRISIIGRNIIQVENIPEEIPEHQDGALTRIQLSDGRAIHSTLSYDEVTRMWHETLEHTL